MNPSRRSAVVFSLSCVAAAGAAAKLRPSHRASETYPPVDLERQVPLSFGGWRLDRSVVPVLPDPGLQAALNKIYNQVLARTYVDASGRQVMLSIAYGADQGTDATAVHRPEFCYVAQGFSITSMGERSLEFDGKPLKVRRLVGVLQRRREPITYWVTLNDRAVLPGVSRKVEQIRLGLLGQIPDGMLVRVSTLVGDGNDAAGFAVQERFLAALRETLAEPLRARYFGF